MVGSRNSSNRNGGLGGSFTEDVRRRINRCIGKGLYVKNVEFRNSALMKNPNVRRYYSAVNAVPLFGGPAIGMKYDVGKGRHHERNNLDVYGGLTGFTYDTDYDWGGFRYSENMQMVSNMENLRLHQLRAFTDAPYNMYYVKEGLERNMSFVEANPIRSLNDIDVLERLFDFEHDYDQIEGNRKFGYGPDVQRTRDNLKSAVKNTKFAIKEKPKSKYVENTEIDELYSKYSVGKEYENTLESIAKISYDENLGYMRKIKDSEVSESEEIFLYNEPDGKKEVVDFNSGKADTTELTVVDFNRFNDFLNFDGTSGLLKKTNDLFKANKIDSLINRFYTGVSPRNIVNSNAYNEKYGYSRGRNLTKRGHEYGNNEVNGYDDPYCRVWTSHHQYSKMKHLIRPFTDEDGNFAKFSKVQENYGNFRPNNGAERLDEMSAMETNGLARIAPHNADDVKRCMFSLENLAWKDINFDASVDGSKILKALSKEQRGPNGGRIMWFPPYNLKFNEQTSVQWEPSSFIGRGENVYTYNNTERKGTLSFTLLIDHPSVVSRWAVGREEEKRENELRLLRFFAGCDAGDVNGNGRYLNDWIDVEEESTVDISIDGDIDLDIENIDFIPVDPEPDGLTDQEYRCYVFFPNNFSGSDYVEGNGDVNTAIEYLISGYSGNPGGYEMQDGPVKGCIGQEYIESKCWSSNRDIKWYYEVDRLVKTDKGGMEGPPINECLTAPNYKDRATFGLNDNIFDAIFNSDKTRTENGETIQQILGFSDWDYDRCISDLINFKDFSRKYPSGKIGIFETNLTDEVLKKYDVSIQLRGNASSHGLKNERLARNRGNLIKKWLIQNGVDPEWIKKDIPIREIETGDKKIDGDVNKIRAKVGRSTEIVINLILKDEYKTPSVDIFSEIQENRETDRITFNTEKERLSDKMVISIPTKTYVTSNNDPMEEYVYFKEVNKDDNLVRQRIVKKVKYFDPAFHSITPEGFNARLTFLQQCTRQGPTSTMGDANQKNNMAGNLAFGRPPICVLRIGDFFNTKIIIDSISINYDNNGGVQWDMNPEGAGLQPMLADVSLGFTFLGGSDISGPVARLQNAVSSNFYANTSIYDARSDYRAASIGNESENGSDNPLMVYDPNLPKNNNTTHRKMNF